jgi:hypothetical protein
MAVTEPENKWWTALNLESPEALIKVFVSQSGCFTLVDRGKGLAAAQAERALAGGGELRGGSNIGKGQMKAADYVLVPDIVNRNANSGGKNVGGILGGMLGGVAGAVMGGISLKSKTADVVLTLTDVRSTEQVSLQQGHAKKTDLGWGAGGGAFFGGLTKTYKNGVQALKGIDLDVEEGDFFAMLGPERRRQDHADRHRHVAGQQDRRQGGACSATTSTRELEAPSPASASCRRKSTSTSSRRRRRSS